MAKSIVWQLEAWETIIGEQKRRFQRPNDYELSVDIVLDQYLPYPG